MTARRSPTTRRTPVRTDRDPLVVTKMLVAHRPPAPDEFEEPGWGPRDGEPVGLPAPCARLVAGYWCTCGSGFAAISGWEETSHARVAAADDARWAGFVDRSGDYIEPGVRSASDADRRRLQEQVEALPVGALVERHGTGIALAFSVEDRRQRAMLESEWGEQMPF